MSDPNPNSGHEGEDRISGEGRELTPVPEEAYRIVVDELNSFSELLENTFGDPYTPEKPLGEDGYAGLLAPICVENDPDAQRLIELALIAYRLRSASTDELEVDQGDVNLASQVDSEVNKRILSLKGTFRSDKEWEEELGSEHPLGKLTVAVEEHTGLHEQFFGPEVDAAEPLSREDVVRYLAEVYSRRPSPNLVNDHIRQSDLAARYTFFNYVSHTGKVPELEFIAPNPDWLPHIGVIHDKPMSLTEKRQDRLLLQGMGESTLVTMAALVGVADHNIKYESFVTESMLTALGDSSEQLAHILERLAGSIRIQLFTHRRPLTEEFCTTMIEAHKRFLGATNLVESHNPRLAKISDQLTVITSMITADLDAKMRYLTSLSVRSQEINERYSMKSKDIKSTEPGKKLLSDLVKGFGGFAGFDADTSKMFAAQILMLSGMDTKALDKYIDDYAFERSIVGYEIDSADPTVSPVIEWLLENRASIAKHDNITLQEALKNLLEYLDEVELFDQIEEEEDVARHIDHFSPPVTEQLPPAEVDDSETNIETPVVKKTQEEIWEMIRRIRDRSIYVDVYAFPPGRKQLEEELEIERKSAEKKAKELDVKIDWIKIDVLLNFLDELEKTEEFAGQLHRTKEGTMKTRFPYYVLEIEHIKSGEKYYIAENPAYPNATYLFSASQFAALELPWEVIVEQFWKEDMRDFGALKRDHVHGATHQEHIDTVRLALQQLMSKPDNKPTDLKATE